MKKLTKRFINKKSKNRKLEQNTFKVQANKVVGEFLAKEHKHITSSQLEQKVKDIFDSRDIKYVHQYKLGYYYYDFLVGDSIVLEIHGEYYHQHPKLTRKYGKAKFYSKQRTRDKKKARLAVKRGFRYRVVWESDIMSGKLKYLERVISELFSK